MVHDLDVKPSTSTSQPKIVKSIPSTSIETETLTSVKPTTNVNTKGELSSPEMNKVGKSVFYDCIDLSPMAEKQDDMKPERNDTDEESNYYYCFCFNP